MQSHESVAWRGEACVSSMRNGHSGGSTTTWNVHVLVFRQRSAAIHPFIRRRAEAGENVGVRVGETQLSGDEVYAGGRQLRCHGGEQASGRQRQANRQREKQSGFHDTSVVNGFQPLGFHPDMRQIRIKWLK